MTKAIFIDPSYTAYYNDLLFSDDPILNRDNCLGMYKPLYDIYNAHTADYLLRGEHMGEINYYSSMGVTKNYKQLSTRKDVILQDFYIFEPPVVAPKLYRKLPELTRYFKRVFIHNTEGVGYSLRGVDKNKLHKLYWPQPYNEPMPEYWNNTDRNFLCLINSNIKAIKQDKELYSERLRAIIYFAKNSQIDVYGKGWDEIFPKRGRIRYHFIPQNIIHHKLIKSVYQGRAKSKYETLSRYKFTICYENMIMPGYMTEKIFDCFVAGSIPVYLGAPDVTNYVPKDCFIDFRDFDNNYEKLNTFLCSLTEAEVQKYRDAGKSYMLSNRYQPYTKEHFAQELTKPILSNNL